MKYFLPYLIVIILLQSACISNNQLIKQSKKYNSNVRIAINIDGEYKNEPDTIIYKTQTLWQALYDCKSFKTDKTVIPSTAILKLKLVNKRVLHVALMDGNFVIDEFDLAVKHKGKYIIVKRNIELVPFPFVYYKNFERRLCFYQTDKNSINISYISENTIWILIMAGGNDEKKNQRFEKVN